MVHEYLQKAIDDEENLLEQLVKMIVEAKKGREPSVSANGTKMGVHSP